jgi:hypothetical protein
MPRDEGGDDLPNDANVASRQRPRVDDGLLEIAAKASEVLLGLFGFLAQLVLRPLPAVVVEQRPSASAPIVREEAAGPPARNDRLTV